MDKNDPLFREYIKQQLAIENQTREKKKYIEKLACKEIENRKLTKLSINVASIVQTTGQNDEFSGYKFASAVGPDICCSAPKPDIVVRNGLTEVMHSVLHRVAKVADNKEEKVSMMDLYKMECELQTYLSYAEEDGKIPAIPDTEGWKFNFTKHKKELR